MTGRYKARSDAMRAEKQRIARQLLGQGLTVSQVAAQLRCSRETVYQAQTTYDALYARFLQDTGSDDPGA